MESGGKRDGHVLNLEIELLRTPEREIPPFVTHLLALCDGAVVGSGPIGTVMTSEVMSRTFGVECSVRRTGSRWRLELDGALADR